MKLSDFCFFVPTKYEGKYALYNSFNNTIAVIDDELKTILQSGDFSALPEEHVDALKSIEVLREDDEDELKLLEYKKKSLRFASDKTEFYVIPTYKCNLTCPTCNTGDTTMSEETAENVIEAIKKETENRKSAYLWTCFLGGEPLLEPEITFKISKELSEWAKKRTINFNNFLATSGTLLSEEVINRFYPYVTSMQVTLEGPRSYHDKNRTYTDGKGTFDDVIDGIMLLKERGIHTVINVPVMKENCSLVPELVEYLKGKGIAEGGFIHVRLFLSKGFSNGVCLSHSPLCNEGDDNAKLLMDLWEKVWKKGFRATAKPSQTPYCTCIRDGAYVIDPEGDVYKCIAMVGNPAEKAAVIRNGTVTSETHTFYDLMSRDATKIEECSQCKYVPLCAGGCPEVSRSRYSTYHAPDCGFRKTLFDKRIELFLRFKHPKHFGMDEGVRTPNV